MKSEVRGEVKVKAIEYNCSLLFINRIIYSLENAEKLIIVISCP